MKQCIGFQHRRIRARRGVNDPAIGRARDGFLPGGGLLFGWQRS